MVLPDKQHSNMTLNEFYRRQVALWPLAADNIHALFGVCSRPMRPAGHEEGMPFVIQHNPARIRSTGAKVDAASVAARPCFLCAGSRSSEQIALLPVELDSSLPGLEYEILLNPYPIFPYHFTIPAMLHTPQVIASDGGRRFDDMLRLSRAMEGMALFYNGAKCGASAPDHFHFQAIPEASMTILSTDRPVPFLVYGYQSRDEDEMLEWFARAVAQVRELPPAPDFSTEEPEPRMNVICAYNDGVWKTIVIPRRAHRPDFYGIGEGKFLLSPASVDLGGTIIVPSPADYENLTPETLSSLLRQTTFML